MYIYIVIYILYILYILYMLYVYIYQIFAFTLVPSCNTINVKTVSLLTM